MNKKSMLDRDNVELYILSEEEEEMLVDILKEQMLDELDNEGTDIYTKEELEELKDWDTTLMDGLDEDEALEDFIMELDEINTEISKEEQEKLITEMMARDQELGLYDEDFPMKEWQKEILKKELDDEKK